MKKDFFVGYLPFPAGLKPFYRIIIPALMLAGLLAIYLYAAPTPRVGTGSWDLSTEVSLTGTVALAPYPMLITEERANHPLLVVQIGKIGAEDVLAPFIGQTVSISGWMIERGPWQMLEIEGAGSVSMVTDAAPLAMPEASPGMFASLQGEIVDSKCMLGVMRPGSGKVHRDCAALCVMGGMPPMLLVKNDAGAKAAYLLTGPNGEAIGRDLVPHIAVPVELAGQLHRVGDITVMRVSPNAVADLRGEALLAFGPSIGLKGTSSFCRIPG